MTWSAKAGTALWLDDGQAATGVAVPLAPLTKAEGTPGLCLGSDPNGKSLAQAQFDELFLFTRTCTTEEIQAEFKRTALQTTLGPVTVEEDAIIRAAAAVAQPPVPAPTGPQLDGPQPAACEPQLTLTREGSSVRITIVAVPNEIDDVFVCFAVQGVSLADSQWQIACRGGSGDQFVFHADASSELYVLAACRQDGDGDGLTDAYEQLVSKTDPDNQDADGDGLIDPFDDNVLVNDPQQDFGREQNTQFESSCAVVNGKVVVAFVDSNEGVYGLGYYQVLSPLYPTNAPRMAAWSVSEDGGKSFVDHGAPPLSRAEGPTTDDGDAGDPVLAVDREWNVLYLVGTSPRNAGNHGFPLWKSVDYGATFQAPVTVGDEVADSDKPWIAVDDLVDAQQQVFHDVYIVGSRIHSSTKDIWLRTSPGGNLSTWNSVNLRSLNDPGVSDLGASDLEVGPNHVAYVVWIERETGSSHPGLKICQVANHGQDMGEIRTVCTFRSALPLLYLKRSNSAAESDYFRAYPMPVLAVNPAKANHVYVAYADEGEAAGDRADVFFTWSMDGGVNWAAPQRISTVSQNDQWMPVLAIKPDGNQMFAAWYDRRQSPDNSRINLFGRWWTLPTGTAPVAGAEFRITSADFPPVFAGTLAGTQVEYTEPGRFDPAYPPGDVNLHWHYGVQWPAPPPEPPDEHVTFDYWKAHVGEYNGAWAESDFVYCSWTDGRLNAVGTRFARSQTDIRLTRLAWPQ